MLQCAVSHLWFCFSCRSLSVHFQDVLFSWCAMPTDKFMLFFIPIVLFLTCVIIWQTGDQSPKISSNIAHVMPQNITIHIKCLLTLLNNSWQNGVLLWMIFSTNGQNVFYKSKPWGKSQIIFNQTFFLPLICK